MTKNELQGKISALPKAATESDRNRQLAVILNEIVDKLPDNSFPAKKIVKQTSSIVKRSEIHEDKKED